MSQRQSVGFESRSSEADDDMWTPSKGAIKDFPMKKKRTSDDAGSSKGSVDGGRAGTLGPGYRKATTQMIFDGMVNTIKRGSTGNLDGRAKTQGPQLIDQYLMYEHILEEKNAVKIQIVEQMWFRSFVAVACLANLIFLGLEADFDCWKDWWGAKCPDRPQYWVLVDMAFTVIFLVEIAIRTWCYDWQGFMLLLRELGIIRFSNIALPCADLIVVLLRAIDVFVLTQMGMVTGLKLLSSLRVAHSASVIKSLRLVRFFRELWLIVSGVGETLHSLFYIMLILMVVLWCFAIMFTLAVFDDGNDAFDYSMAAWEKDDYWGTIAKSCFTLFQICTGDKWASSIVRPLLQQKPGLILLFIPFFGLALMGLLNGIIGIVVENVLNSARANDESEGKEKRMVDAKVMESLRTIFKEADTDGSNSLEYEELVAAGQVPKVRRRMQVLEIPVKDLDLLFAMLDEERKGSINIDVFFRGCARMRGPAMAADLHQMSVDLDRNIRAAETTIQSTEAVNDVLERLINQLDVVEVDVVRADFDDKDPVLMARRERMKKAALEEKAKEEEEAPVELATQAA